MFLHSQTIPLLPIIPTNPPNKSLATRSPLISITLTCSNTTFTLHKALLCHYSAYFSTVCNGRWSESSSGVITLDEVDEEVFNLFVYWLYTQRIPESIQDVLEVARTEELEEGEKKSRDAKLGGSNGVVNKRKGFFVLLKAAVLGDRLLCPGFYAAACNACMYRLPLFCFFFLLFTLSGVSSAMVTSSFPLEP